MVINTRKDEEISASLPGRARRPGVDDSKFPVRSGPIALLQIVLVLVLVSSATAYAQKDRAEIESVSATLSYEGRLTLESAQQRTAPTRMTPDSPSQVSQEFPSATEVIYYDGFEGTFPGPWVLIDNNGSTGGEVLWDATSYRADVGSWSAGCAAGGTNASPPGTDYKNDMASWMIYGPFSLSDAVGGSLSFRLWNDSEEGYDGVLWSASINGNNFYGGVHSGNSGGWISESLDFTDVPTLGDITGEPSVWIAFWFLSDNIITTGEGAYVDEVRIEKTLGGPPVLRVQPTDLRFEREAGDSAGAFSKYLVSREAQVRMTMPPPQRLAKLEQLARQSGSVPVIVGISEAFIPEGFLELNQVAQQRSTFVAAQQGLLSRLSPDLDYLPQTVKEFETVPYLALHVTEFGLQMLQDDPEVVSIQEDRPEFTTLSDSVPLVGASVLHTSGVYGTGTVVAVLDTGVDKGHPFLTGKVVSEACYSTDNDVEKFSLCPGASTSSTAPGSGVNCSASITGCDHGTHVAGIAVGDGANPGVAPGAELIAIQVFTGLEDTPGSTPCADAGRSSPCISSYPSDHISALERVYALRNSYNIASVNMSIGSGTKHTDPCDSDSRKAIVDNLRSAGIATVSSSGNSEYTDGLGNPECISSVISVGSTTILDAVSWFSNSAYFLDLLAPGENIRSSVPGGGFDDKNGTSMAAPHVSGALALLRSGVPSKTVDDLLVALKLTGVPILDSRNGLTKPRIRVDSALDWLENPNLQVGSFFIHNDGGTQLTVSSLALNTAAGWIDWIPKSPFEVTPGGSQEVVVAVDFDLAPDGQSTRQLNVNSNGGSAAVEIVVNNTDELAPPTNLVATTVSSTQINLSWTENSDNETGFKIERSPNGTSSWAQIATMGADATTYQNTGLTPSTTYYYRVCAYVGAVDSDYSNTANATTNPGPSLTAPSDLTATAISSSRIDLSWTDNSSGELGFKIERSPNGTSSWTPIATVGANVTIYQNTGLVPSTTYYYRVRAYNASVDSAYSNTANATTPPNPPAAPSSLVASAVSSSQINLSWTDNSGNETGFKIERGASGGGPFSEVASVGPNQTTYQNTGLNASTTYYYRIRAYNAGGHSAFSNTASDTTWPPDFDVPGNFTIGGYLGVGTDSPERAVHLKGSNSVFRMDRSTNSAAFLLARTNDAGQPLKTFVVGVNASGANQGEFIINDLGTALGGGGQRRMTIDNSGDVEFEGSVRAAEFIPTSSLRFKTNIRALDNPLETVSRLRGVQFDWKATGKPSLGLIAEEVAQVLPEVVSHEADGQTRGVNYDSLVALLVEASKAQERELEALNKRQVELQAVLQELKRLNQDTTQGGEATNEKLQNPCIGRFNHRLALGDHRTRQVFHRTEQTRNAAIRRGYAR